MCVNGTASYCRRKEKGPMAMEERPMAVGFIISFPGGTQEQYDTVLEQLNLGGRMARREYFMPPGRVRKAGG
jgi:hypothetical protein